jgi:hypothetical protein
MDKIRRQALDKFAKDVKDYDLTDSGLYLPKQKNIANAALSARDLAEDALGNELLKTTGVSIPGKGATKSQIENFLQDIVKEQYSDLPEGKLEIKKLGNYEGLYEPTKDLISLDEEMVRKNPAKAVGTLMHEQGHRVDPKGIKHNPIDNKAFRDIKSAIDVNVDPTEIYEKASIGHHAKIPGIREGSYGLSNLKNILKGKAIRSLVPLAGTAAAISSGDVAAAIPGLDLAESLGDASRKNSESDEQAISASKQMRESGELNPEMFKLLRSKLQK